MIRGLLILLTAGILAASALPASGSGDRARVVFDQAYPPYMYGSGDTVRGLYPTIVRAVFDRDGIAIDAQGYPWGEALQLAEKGGAAIAGLYKNRDREKVLAFSDPIHVETLRVYVKRGEVFPFRGLSDLRGKTVGIDRQWSYGDAIDQARQSGVFSALESADDREGFEKLLAGEVDCVIADELSASEIVQEQQYGDKVEALPRPAAVNAVYVAFAKRGSGAEILKGFNASLHGMKQDGSYDRLIGAFNSAYRLDRRLLERVEQALGHLANAIIRDAPIDKSRAFTMLEAYLHNNPEIYGAAFAFAPRQQNGRTVKSSPYVLRNGARLVEKDLIDSYDYTAPDQEWYIAPVSRGKPVWTEPYFDKGGGDVWMRTYSVPIYGGGPEHRLVGIVTSDIRVPSP